MANLLTLTVNGTPFEPPGSVSHITPDKVGPFGGNIFALSVDLLLILVAVLALFYMIWAGIQWILSGGDKHGVEAARQKIIYAVIGLIVAFSAFAILKLVGNFFNVELV